MVIEFLKVLITPEVYLIIITLILAEVIAGVFKIIDYCWNKEVKGEKG